jgi:hypothetical protein
MELPETAAVVAAVCGDAQQTEAFIRVNVEASPDSQRTTDVYFRCLAPLLAEVMRGLEESTPLEQGFEHAWHHLTKFVYDFESLKYVWKIHLTGIKTEVNHVDLSDTVCLRRANLDEQTRAWHVTNERTEPWGMSDVPQLPPVYSGHRIPYVVAEIPARHTFPRQRPDSSYARSIGNRLVEALRLVGDGGVHGHTIWRDDHNPFVRDPYPIEWFDMTYPVQWGYPEYVVTPHRAETLVHLWESMDAPTTPGALALARRRFEDSYRRNALVDRLLDYWIGLEALFLKKDAELSFRASLRIAQYLGETPDEKLDTYNLARLSYGARSKVAHGDVKVPEEAMVVATGDLLRRAIRRTIEEGFPPDGDALDRALLS